MAETLVLPKSRIERLRQALQRYCQQELGDWSATVEILPDPEFPDMLFVPVIISSAFGKMSDAERQDSIWKFLRNDKSVNRGDFSGISRIATRVD
jgi:hypothetical protein